MTSPLLTQALDYVFHDEGGYAERPTEGGGAVNMGVTFTVFAAERQLAGKPKPTFADLKAMTRDEATAIYAAQFAAPIQFDKLAPGIGYVVLDSCINNGVGGATKFVQEVVHEKVDGHLGAVTLWALLGREASSLRLHHEDLAPDEDHASFVRSAVARELARREKSKPKA